MTRLRLVESEPREGPFEVNLPPAERLPHGRHGIPADLVAAHQRRRLIAAMAGALAEHGYSHVTAEHVSERAGVSSRTFYKHFGNLWDCLLAAYETAAHRLRGEIEGACAAQEDRSARLPAAIEAALAFLASEPALAQLLCARPPLEAASLAIARRRLIERLAAMLHSAWGPSDDRFTPPGIDERLIDGTFTFVSTRVVAGQTDGLAALAPELTEILVGPRRAA
jgi:AcrR family transcriptional regulator